MDRDLDLRDFSGRLRLAIVQLHKRAGGGHLGSALSIVEALAVIFGRHFRWRGDEDGPYAGDRFVLSKGHAAMALYCALALIGRIDPRRLVTFGRNGSPLEPHPNESAEPAIHASTGSLGQGLSIGVGLALGAQLRGSRDRTFVVIGDGECNEGQIWEAARSAATLALPNLVVILDDNGMQQDGPTSEIMPVRDTAAAWKAMGWQILECDGHDTEAIAASLDALLVSSDSAPRLLRTHTIKGKGIVALEGRTESHFPPPVADEELTLLKYFVEEGARV
jgi:transketolase